MMIAKPCPNGDPRTVGALVNTALSEIDDEAVWNAIWRLQERGGREVLQRAEELCGSRCSLERRLGADILGQLGASDRTFPVECSKRLRSLLKKDEDVEVLRAALVGLSHQFDVEAIPLVASFSTHPDPEVRHAAVLALTGHEIPLAIKCLITLSKDAVADVRDWATFALGTQIQLDTPDIRDALADRLEDPDDDTRAEALSGLARRNDGRVIDALKRELSSDCMSSIAIEAAEMIASSELYPYLIALRERQDIDTESLERAVSASR